MDYELESKYKKIEKSYNGYKKVVLQWESAFGKTEGRKPEKNDLRQAPSNVKHSYDKYCKYKKVLAELSAAMKMFESNNRKVKGDNSLTPQKIFKSFQCVPKPPPSLPVPQPEKSSKRGKGSPQIKMAFTKNLSKKLFLMQPSRARKKLTTDESSVPYSSMIDSSQPDLNISTTERPDSEESPTSSRKQFDESSSFEMESINLSGHFGSEEDIVEVPETLYSNFLADYSQPSLPDTAFKTRSIINSDGTNSGPPSLALSEYNGSSNDGSSNISELNTIAEEVRNCFDILNSSNGDSAYDDHYFPFSSFVNKAACAVEDENNESIDSSLASFPTSCSSGDAPLASSEESSVVPNADVDYRNKENRLKSPSPVKRKFSYAFSPSPEKQAPKKKIFKSDRKTLARNVSLKSCLPEIPTDSVSRKTVKSQPTTSTSEAVNSTLSFSACLKSSPPKLNDVSSVAKPGRRGLPRRRIKSVSSDSEEWDTSPKSNPPRQLKEVSSKAKSGRKGQPRRRIKSVSSDSEECDSSPKKNPPRKLKEVSSKAKPGRKGLPRRKITPATGDSEECGSSPKRDSVSKTIVVVDTFDDVTKMDESRSRGKKSKRMPRKQLKPKKSINDNYVSIDVAKKVFVRKKKGMTGFKMKHLDWKKKKSIAVRECKLKSLTCTKCGDIGHFSRFCLKGKLNLEDLPVEDVDDSPWPTVEEAARMAWSKSAQESQQTRTAVYSDTNEIVVASDNATSDTYDTLSTQPVEASSSTFSSVFSLANPSAKTTDPYFSEDSGIEMEGNLEYDMEQGLKLFGYQNFRSGQKEAILRILKGESTLLMLSTGSGKSLCYQLPAYLYSKKYPGTLTVCVSPLVSLMEDQVDNIPVFLKAACLHYNMTDKKKDAVKENVKARKIQILLVSPEALCGGLFGLFRNVDELPPIGFACIDEVHCVSEWSHNFRPSYLQVCKILREKMKIKTILGLTATATSETCVGICKHLQVDPSTVIRGEIIPKNLNLSISRDTERDVALVQLLNGERFRNCDSIIIYCTRREECNRIAEVVRTHVKVNPKFETITKWRGRSRVSNNCEAYHAGLTAARRMTIQKQFMQGTIRIVVATIAFGMGINKSDIRSVIHYNMPQTFESYVQEIGRAGRDGLEANCHLFLDNMKGRDISELKRHIFANSVDRVTIRKLIKLIFKPCKCKRVEKIGGVVKGTSGEGIDPPCPGHEVSFSVNKTVEELDLPEENIETLLCHLEVDKNRRWIELLPKTYALCKIHSYGGPKLLKATALKSPPLAVAIALEKEKKNFKDDDVYLEFNVIEAAANVGWNSAVVRRELKSLEWVGSEYNSQGKPTKFRKSGLMIEFTELAFRCNAIGDLTDKDYDLVFNSLCDFNANQERRQLFQLQKVYQSMASVSTPTINDARDDYVPESSDALKACINEYFHQDNSGVPANWKPVQQGLEKEEDIRREVRNLILSYKDTKFTGRSVAKIFQGINSPNFPSIDWCRNRAFWRRFLDVDFHVISKIASEEIITYN